MINIGKFIWLYSDGHSMNESQESGLCDVLRYINEDTNITDIRHIAYMLATVRHECANTWKPVEEYGKGKGKKYGIQIDGKAYYGRGYVQLTWIDNYRNMGNKLAVPLVDNPDLACNGDVAYKIMSLGMRKGMFTGKKLSDYINADKCDYVSARRIINGQDCAGRIAGYATEFEKILREVTE